MGLKERVQALCKKKGVTAQQAEIDLGLGKGYISKLNASVPNAGNIQKMATYFGVSSDFIIIGEDEQKETPLPEAEAIGPNKRALIDFVMGLNEEESRMCRSIVESVVKNYRETLGK